MKLIKKVTSTRGDRRKQSVTATINNRSEQRSEKLWVVPNIKQWNKFKMKDETNKLSSQHNTNINNIYCCWNKKHSRHDLLTQGKIYYIYQIIKLIYISRSQTSKRILIHSYGWKFIFIISLFWKLKCCRNYVLQ